MEWMYLALARNKWWAVRRMVMELEGPYNVSNFLTN